MDKDEVNKSSDMKQAEGNIDDNQEEKEKLSLKDFLAICIAVFQIVMPMVLIGLLLLTLVLLFITKVWFK